MYWLVPASTSCLPQATLFHALSINELPEPEECAPTSVENETQFALFKRTGGIGSPVISGSSLCRALWPDRAGSRKGPRLAEKAYEKLNIHPGHRDMGGRVLSLLAGSTYGYRPVRHDSTMMLQLVKLRCSGRGNLQAARDRTSYAQNLLSMMADVSAFPITESL
ncbi:hypothetical protein TWF281_004875 [Arthrobotrys megalospora]